MFVLPATNRAHQRHAVQINLIKYAAQALLEVNVLSFYFKEKNYMYDFFKSQFWYPHRINR